MDEGWGERIGTGVRRRRAEKVAKIPECVLSR